MPMGIVSDKDFNSESNKLNPKPPTKEKGRGKGNVEVPDSLRRIIGDTAETEGREAALALARDFGISPSSVSAYSNGATSTSTYNTRPNLPTIKNAKARISKKARAKLLMAMNHITENKLEDLSAPALAGIAKDMSAIVRNMDDDTDDKTKEGPQKPAFLVYAPTVNQENHYQTVIAKD
jgi:hypothetical protein